MTSNFELLKKEDNLVYIEIVWKEGKTMMILLKAIISRKNLKCQNSVKTEEFDTDKGDQNAVTFFSPMVDMLCQFIDRP